MKSDEEKDKKPERKGSAGKEEELKKNPPESMEDINELENDVTHTEVNPVVKKRTPLNKQDGDSETDPNRPVNPPGYTGL